MLKLSTVDLLRVITDSAATLDVTCDHADNASGVITENAPTLTQIASITTTTVVAAPASGVRNVKAARINNTHATLAVTVTVVRERSGATPGNRECKETLQPGDRLTLDEGVGWYRVAASSAIELIRTLSADASGQNIATVQPIFPSTGAATLAASTLYRMEGRFTIVRAAGVTSHTTSISFGGTATLTTIAWDADVNTGDVSTTSAVSRTSANVATSTAVKAASTSATEYISILIYGHVRSNAAGTFIPQFTYSAIPGGAPTIKADTFISLKPLGSSAMTAQGTWS